MRLWELFGEISPSDIKSVERKLDTTEYQPPEKIKAEKPVIDLDLLSSPHFRERLIQRSKSAGITPAEIEDLFHKGRDKYKIEIGQATRQDQFHGNQIDFFDPETKLLVPTIVTPNPNCKPNTRGKVTCQTVDGPEPKNRLVAKTIMRKGTPD